MAFGERSLAVVRGGRLIPGLLSLTLVLFLFALFYFFTEGPNRGLVLVAASAAPFLVIRLGVVALRDRLDHRLGALLADQLQGYRVVVQDFPDYRWVDVFGAIEKELPAPGAEFLDSCHPEDLGAIVKGNFTRNGGFVQEPSRQARPVDPSHEEYFPTERFWIRERTKNGQSSLVARFRYLEYSGAVRLEVASRDVKEAERFVSKIRERSASESIYRGRVIELSFMPGINDESGNVDHYGRVKVDFRKAPGISANEIVLDTRIWPIIEHSLVRFSRAHAALGRCRVALKRGLLFYGPPGTGKSFTCRYVASLLPGTTIIWCAGGALHHVSSIFNLAKMLKPSLVVMEDVDLVFSSRDINLHGGSLGELFDQIDAMGDEQPITMILTTNAIERVERAVKDRPGRVSQCVYFGPPLPELRRRYLLSFLKGHTTDQVDMDRIVRETDGATQVFLKELVNRALQFAVEAGRAADTAASPTTSDFIAALEEIRAFDGKAVRNVTGFRVDPTAV